MVLRVRSCPQAEQTPGTERGAGEWERITWEQAFDEIGEAINKSIEKYGSRSIMMNKFWCGVPAADRSTGHDLAMGFIDALGGTVFEGPSVDMSLIYASLTDMGGLISNSKYLANELRKYQGLEIDSFFTVPTVENCIYVTNPPSKEKAESKRMKFEPKVREAAKDIAQRKRASPPRRILLAC